MALTDDELILRSQLELDISEAEKEVSKLKKALATLIKKQQEEVKGGGVASGTTINAIKEYKKLLKDSEGRLSALRNEMKSLGDEGGKAVDGLNNKLGALFTVGAATTFAKRVMDTRSQFQQLEIAFTTLLKSEDKANKLMSDAVDLAAKTPFDLQGVANGARQLIAYGFAADDVIEDIRRLGDVAAGLGLPLQRLTYLYGTTRVQGRLYARDMLQFTNSGIPMLDQLAKMYGKTTNEINEMVSAGKIGFEDIKKAIYAMTDEGGQFANLMEKQSKSIGGQISNIQDALDSMFNEIGKKSEGVINAGLGAVSWMVEHYETLGKVLGSVVVTYGAARAATMTYSAVLKVSKKLTEGATLASLARQRAEAALAKTLGITTTAQKGLNKAMFANPYVIAASAVMALGAALVSCAIASTKGAAGVRSFNKYVEEQQKSLKDNQAAAESYIKTLESETATQEERTAAVQALLDKYPQLADYYKNEADLLNDILNVKKLIGAQDKENAYNADMARLAELETNLTNLRNMSMSGNDYGFTTYSHIRDTEKEISLLKDKIKKDYGNMFDIGPTREDFKKAVETPLRNVDSVLSDIKDTEKSINTLQDKAKKKGLTADEKKNLEDYQKQLKTLQAEYQTYTGKSYGGSKSKDNTMAKDVEEAAKKAEDAHKKLVDNMESLTADSEKLAADAIENTFEQRIRQNEIDANRELAMLKKQKDERLKLLQEEDEAKQRMENPNAEVKTRITGLPKEELEMFAKMEAQIFAGLKRSNAAVYDELLDEYGGYEREKYNLTKEWDEKIAAAENGGLDKEFIERLKLLKEASLADLELGNVSDYGSFLNDILPATIKKLNAEMALLPENMKAGGERAAQETMADLAEAFAASAEDISFTKWYNNLGEKTFKALQEELDRTQTYIDDMESAGDLSDSESDALARAKLEIAALKKKIQELTGAQKESNINWKEASDILNRACDTFNEIGEAIGGVVGETISNLGTLVSGCLDVANAIKAIKDTTDPMEKATGFISVISAAVKIISKFVNILKENTAADLEATAANARYAQSVRELNDALREKSYINAFGTDSYGLFKNAQRVADEAKRNLSIIKDYYDGIGEALAKTYGGMISPDAFTTLTADMRSSWQKFIGSSDNIEKLSLGDLFLEDGTFDGERLKEWYAEYGEYISESQKTMVDGLIAEWERYEASIKEMDDYLASLFDPTAESMADSMISAFMETGDALLDLTDLANSFGRNMAKSMVVSQLMEVFNKEAQDKIKELLLNGDASGAVEMYNRLLEQANAQAPAITEFLKALNMDVDPDERQGEQKGIAQASQDSVDELNGRATVIQTHTFQINENVKAIRDQNQMLIATSSSILDEVRGIHDDTRSLDAKVGEVLNNQAKINSNISWIIDKGVRAN